MHAMPPVALLTVDSPIGLAIMRELGQRGVRVIAIGKTAQSLGRYSRYAAQFVVRPPGPIANWLEHFAARHGVNRIMAVSETDLLQLAAYAAEPASTVCCAVPTLGKMKLVLDKNAIASVASAQGITVPKSWQPASANLEALDGLTFPVAVKWADPVAMLGILAQHGLPLVKVEYANSAGELQRVLNRYGKLGHFPMIQEYCPGYGFGQMFHMYNGKATLRFQHRRLREFPLTGGVSSYCAAVPVSEHRELMKSSENLLRAIEWEGPAMVEYKIDPVTGTERLMEINGRFWGSQPLASVSGAHFGWETYRFAFLRDQHAPRDNHWRIRNARYAAPEIKNLIGVAKSGVPISEKLSFAARFARDFLNWRTRWYVWSTRDPMPFICDSANVLKRFWRREK